MSDASRRRARAGPTSGKTADMRRAAALVLALSACSTAALGDSETLTGSTGAASATASTNATTGVSASDSEPTTGMSGSATGEGTGAGSTTSDGGLEDYGQPGDFPVGNRTFTLNLPDRPLLVEVWYPAEAAAKPAADAGEAIVEFVPAGPDRDAMVDLLGKLGEPGKVGVTLQTHSARDAVLADMSQRPLVLLSHCHNCTRFSLFTVAEHLASRGFVVAAPDHAGNTLFDSLKGMTADIGEEFLLVRVGDLRGLLDALLDPNNADVPAALKGIVDPKKVGAMGHSFGSATAGRIAQDDDRIVSALPIFAPVENPFFPGTKVKSIAEPTLFALAVEDNSIQKIGNDLIEMNFKTANTPTRLLTLADTGHWGVTDICGLVADFEPGCGPGTRMTDMTAFTYQDPAIVRGVVGAYAAAFFALTLEGDASAAAYLDVAQPAGVVEVMSRL